MPGQADGRWRLAGLVIAVVAAAALVGLPLAPPVGLTSAPPSAPSSVPAELIESVPTVLADGSSYALRYVLGPGHSVGTSMSVDGSSFRLVEVVDGRAAAELRRRPTATGPQYDGFTADDGRLFWIETVIGPDGVSRSQLWSATVAPGDKTATVTTGDKTGTVAPGDKTATVATGDKTGTVAAVTGARVLVDDMGLVVSYDSAHDLVAAGGTLSWVVVANPTRPGTILRSMPVDGGPVSGRGFGGPWRQTARPWLVSATVGAVSLLNTDTGQVHTVPATASDSVECGPQWCHFAVQNDGETVRLGIMRPDGTQRTRIAGPGSRLDSHDPALLGRYELFSEYGGELPEGNRRLLVYDITLATTRVVETGPGGLATSRGGYAWWISGDYRSPVWHVLDLSALDP